MKNLLIFMPKKRGEHDIDDLLNKLSNLQTVTTEFHRDDVGICEDRVVLDTREPFLFWPI